MRTTTISRDPFARSETVRQTVTGHSADDATGFAGRLYACDWCGRTRTTRNGHPTAYRYGTERDDRPGRPDWHKGTFCSKQCHDSYHA